ncbi:MAG: dienelactone hydrolase [Proteobacteria bacterium ST_bin13]|nr:MAG: dienelactone hydrolase [Proteobacteria bacterium ST_bin13]
MSLRITLAAIFLTPVVPVAQAQPAQAQPVQAQPVQAGFERLTTPDGTELGIWYPASGTPARQQLGLYAHEVIAGARVPSDRHPLIVFSHGTGGDFAGHVDTAVALARAGFIVAALTHPGDNWRDTSRATRIEERPAALSATITYMVQTWRDRASIDADRVGAFGFSAGGFTVLAAAGGRPDLTRLQDHCAQHPKFFDCALIKAQKRTTAPAWPNLRDARIKAIVVAAPALGFTFDRAGLAGVRVPVQLWRADNDQILPTPYYADAVRAALPGKPEFHSVADAGHFDFLAPCANPAIMPQLCKSAQGFDRAAFHASFDVAIVAFFSTKLATRRPH